MMPTGRDDEGANMGEDMRELAEAAAAGRRSKLHVWMYRNHAKFQREVLEAAGRPNWDALAAEFTKRGQTVLKPDGAEIATTGEGARKVWLGVRKRLEREATAREVKAKAQAARTAPQGVRTDPASPYYDDSLSMPMPDDFADIEAIQ